MRTIKILGPGCANCNRLEVNTRLAVEALGLSASVLHVRDYGVIAGYGVMRTPGLVVDERLIVSGRVPTVDEVKEWLRE